MSNYIDLNENYLKIKYKNFESSLEHLRRLMVTPEEQIIKLENPKVDIDFINHKGSISGEKILPFEPEVMLFDID